MLTTLISIGRPSSLASAETSGCPSTISETSKDVPPMSIPISWGREVWRDNSAQAMAPPTGPDSSVCSGRARADSAVRMPPEDCMT